MREGIPALDLAFNIQIPGLTIPKVRAYDFPSWISRLSTDASMHAYYNDLATTCENAITQKIFDYNSIKFHEDLIFLFTVTNKKKFSDIENRLILVIQLKNLTERLITCYTCYHLTILANSPDFFSKEELYNVGRRLDEHLQLILDCLTIVKNSLEKTNAETIVKELGSAHNAAMGIAKFYSYLKQPKKIISAINMAIKMYTFADSLNINAEKSQETFTVIWQFENTAGYLCQLSQKFNEAKKHYKHAIVILNILLKIEPKKSLVAHKKLLEEKIKITSPDSIIFTAPGVSIDGHEITQPRNIVIPITDITGAMDTLSSHQMLTSYQKVTSAGALKLTNEKKYDDAIEAYLTTLTMYAYLQTCQNEIKTLTSLLNISICVKTLHELSKLINNHEKSTYYSQLFSTLNHITDKEFVTYATNFSQGTKENIDEAFIKAGVIITKILEYSELLSSQANIKQALKYLNHAITAKQHLIMLQQDSAKPTTKMLLTYEKLESLLKKLSIDNLLTLNNFNEKKPLPEQLIDNQKNDIGALPSTPNEFRTPVEFGLIPYSKVADKSFIHAVLAALTEKYQSLLKIVHKSESDYKRIFQLLERMISFEIAKQNSQQPLPKKIQPLIIRINKLYSNVDEENNSLPKGNASTSSKNKMLLWNQLEKELKQLLDETTLQLKIHHLIDRLITKYNALMLQPSATDETVNLSNTMGLTQSST